MLHYRGKVEMYMPLEVQILRNNLMTELRQNEEFLLTPQKRLELFEAFGLLARYPSETDCINLLKNGSPLPKNLVLSPAEQALSWLAVITARKNESLWGLCRFNTNSLLSGAETRFTESFSDDPLLFLNTAELVLNKKQAFSEAFIELVDHFEWVAQNFMQMATELEWCIYGAAYNACRVVLLGLIDASAGLAEFLELSLRAYSALDYSMLGVAARRSKEWHSNMPDKNEANRTDKRLLPILLDRWSNEYQPNLNFDVVKRLEFWEWWLTEAIPQAWAMVEE